MEPEKGAGACKHCGFQGDGWWYGQPDDPSAEFECPRCEAITSINEMEEYPLA